MFVFRHIYIRKMIKMAAKMAVATLNDRYDSILHLEMASLRVSQATEARKSRREKLTIPNEFHEKAEGLMHGPEIAARR